MATFNLVCNSYGKIIKTVNADSMIDAQNHLENKGFDCQDDHFLESVEDTNKRNALYSRTIYTDDDGY